MRGHQYDCFVTREEIAGLFRELACGLELVVVKRGNVKEFFACDDVDVLLDPDARIVFLRQVTGCSRDQLVREMTDAARYSGFLLFDMPIDDEDFLGPAGVRYDDSMLESRYPPAKPLFDLFKKRMQKLVGNRRLVWAVNGKRAYAYSEAVRARVEQGVQLVLAHGIPSKEKPSPFRFE
jgi:hypothetical protein